MMTQSYKALGALALIGAASSLAACSSDPIEGGSTGTGGSATDGTGGASAQYVVGEKTLFSAELDGNWIPGDTNTVGIQGAFFVLEDSVKDGNPVVDALPHTDLLPDKFAEGEAPCVSGNLSAVTNEAGGPGCTGDTCQYEAQWGGGIGLNLQEPGGEGSEALTYSATANGVTGFKFALSGTCNDCEVRLKASMFGSEFSELNFCKKLKWKPGEVVEVALSDIVSDCWGTTGVEILDVNNLYQLQWQLVTAVDTTYAVDNFCLNWLEWY